MKKIKAIIFDAYGTLFDVNSAAEKCKGKLGDKWEGFANYWRTTQLEYTWLRSLMRRHKDFWQITEDSLDKSMNFYNIDIAMRSELLNLYKVLSPFTEVRDTLNKLKQSNYFDFMIQQATELGVTNFVPIISERTIVRKINNERLNKIVIESCEHSNRINIPSIEKPQSLD